jgi:hypothetical protein
MHRRTVAFFVAPLAVPLFALVWSFSGHLALGWRLTMMAIAAFLGYGGTLAFGIPAYRFLSARRLTAAWIAGVVGLAIGALMWLVFLVLFPLSLGQGLSGVRLGMANFHIVADTAWPGGVLGAVVGALFWVIARPDRKSS